MDSSLLTFFNQTIAHPTLDIVALIFTTVGFMLLPGVGIALLATSQRRLGWTILITLGIGLVSVLIFQYLGLRPRPTGTRLIWATPNFPSYPSGHATAAFSIATLISLYSHRRIVRLIAFLHAGLLALSRVYLGHHYPTDILGGAVLGTAIGAASYGLLILPVNLSKRQQPPWAWLLWPQLSLIFIASQMAYLNILPLHLLRWPFADKVIHFLAFGTLAFWLNLWLSGRTLRFKWGSVPLAIILLLIFITLEEGSQYFSPLRSLSWGDVLSNVLGVVVFWAISQYLTLRRSSVAN